MLLRVLYWLVVWNMSIFPYIENANPNWLSYFFLVDTSNQWIGSREDLQETIGFPSKYVVLLLNEPWLGWSRCSRWAQSLSTARPQGKAYSQQALRVWTFGGFYKWRHPPNHPVGISILNRQFWGTSVSGHLHVLTCIKHPVSEGVGW